MKSQQHTHLEKSLEPIWCYTKGCTTDLTDLMRQPIKVFKEQRKTFYNRMEENINKPAVRLALDTQLITQRIVTYRAGSSRHELQITCPMCQKTLEFMVGELTGEVTRRMRYRPRSTPQEKIVQDEPEQFEERPPVDPIAIVKEEHFQWERHYPGIPPR